MDISNTCEWIDRIRVAFQNGDIALADSLATEAIEATGGAPEVLEIGGIIAFELEDYGETIRLIEKAMVIATLSIASQLCLARAYIGHGKPELAETGLEFLVEMAHRVPCNMLPDLTNACSSIERYDLALGVCREAAARHPEDDNAIFGAAFYMFRLGYPLELIKNMMLKAIELNPMSNIYRLNITTVFLNLNQLDFAYEHACKMCDDALRTVPCGCMVGRLRELFAHYGDQRRIDLLPNAKQNFGS
ncbi:MAG: hypothetical protein AAF456_09795 [Planctomycetota bacterium]